MLFIEQLECPISLLGIQTVTVCHCVTPLVLVSLRLEYGLVSHELYAGLSLECLGG